MTVQDGRGFSKTKPDCLYMKLLHKDDVSPHLKLFETSVAFSRLQFQHSSSAFNILLFQSEVTCLVKVEILQVSVLFDVGTPTCMFGKFTF